MALENATYVSELSESDPLDGDLIVQGDNHIRLLKAVLKATFPNFNAALSASPADIDKLFETLGAGNVPDGGLQDIAFKTIGTGTGEIPLAEDVELKGGGGAPVGAIYMWPLAAPPAKHLILNGQAVSRTTYADLFAVYGVSFGPGDGSTTFELPDWRSRKPIGAGTGTGLSTRTLNDTGGEEAHQLTIAELPEVDLHQLMGARVLRNNDDDNEVRTGDAGNHDFDPLPKFGNDQPHNNMDPWVATNFIVRAQK